MLTRQLLFCYSSCIRKQRKMLHRLTFIFLQASLAAEREDLFTGLTSSDCWGTGVGVMRDYKKSSLSNVKWIHADMLKFRSTFIELEIQRENSAPKLKTITGETGVTDLCHPAAGLRRRLRGRVTF